MKKLRNVTMTLLAAGMMAACSSTRNAGLGGTSGTTGMDSGSSTDLSNTSGTNNSFVDLASNAVIYENNYNSEGVSVNNNMDPVGYYSKTENNSDSEGMSFNNTTDYSSNSETYGNNSASDDVYGDTRNSNSLFTDDYAKNAPVWSSPLSDDLGNYNTSSMSSFMNGYQGPLNYSSFSDFSSSTSFLPLASTSATRGIELSRIAQQNAQSPDVKAFADLMVQDYSGNSQELGNIAYSQSINLGSSDYAAVSKSDPSLGMEDYDRYYSSDAYTSDAGASNTSGWSDTGASNTDMNSSSGTFSDSDMLRNLSGRHFDRQYMRIMLQDQYHAYALLNSAAQSDDPQVRDFAIKSLPVAYDRLVQATNIYNALVYNNTQL
jgi:predicted outer membrane protein